MSSDSEEESQNSNQDENVIQSKKSFNKKPKDLEIKLSEAKLEIIMNNNIERAKQILDEIISQHARYQRAFIMYGHIWKLQGNYEKAIHHFTIATKIKTSPKLWKKIAILEKKLAQKLEQEQIQSEAIFYHYYQAAKYLGKLLRQRNKAPNIQLMSERVDCLEKCYEYEKGIKQLKVLVDIAISLQQHQLHQESIKRMAKLYVKKNQLEDAKQILKSIPLTDKSTIMICEILEKSKNLEEMRELLDEYFGSKTMTAILKNHSYRLVNFYLQCLQQSFNDYQQIVDFYLNSDKNTQLQEQSCKSLIELIDKLDNIPKQELLQVLYNYRDQFSPQLKQEILTKFNNFNFNSDAQQIIEEPPIPVQPNTKDQILFLYKKLKHTTDVNEKYDFLRKILTQEEKSYNKLKYFDGIKREEYEQLFGRKHKKRRLRKFHTISSQLRKKTTSLSVEIGYQNFFTIILNVFESLLENDKSQELFKLTHMVYQLRLKKIANNDNKYYEEFIQKLAQYGLWASLKERKYSYAPIYLKYIDEQNLILYLIQIIDQNIQPKLRGIFNSFTRKISCFQQSVIPYKLDQLLKLRENDQKNPLYNLLICVKYLQEMTGRLATDQAELFKKSLYYFDCYKDCQVDSLEVKYNLARIYLHINIVNKGMEILEDILSIPQDHPVKWKAGFALMQIHKKLGNNEQAFYYLKQYNTFQ
ncbi:unnamed protein product [Paramecium primaurelia]|uniref:Tetratricopeptide repeat protein n=1 Tax=Paramecium primaurelia TaxID=5886 RepID=A0A8S1NU73_PARPR|nr:unnamed protein product [Paramecium primaurelia]